MKRFLVVLTLVVALVSVVRAQDAARLYKTAMNTEMVDGNLKAAIEQYEKVVAANDRALAAQALLRMAECYQKLGNSEARKVYERLIRDFRDQTDAVQVARTRLGSDQPAVSGQLSPSMVPVWRGRDVSTGPVTGARPLLPHIDREAGNLAVRDLVANRTMLLTHDASWTTVWSESSVASHDGRYVAYEWSDGNHMSLRVVRTDGSDKEPPRVVYDNPDVWSPTPGDWSADGQYLAVRLRHIDRTTQIGLLKVADGTVRILKSLNWSGQNNLRLSPDGKWLAYDLPNAEGREDQHVFALALDGTRQLTLTPSNGDYRLVGWTGDSRRVLFTSGQSSARSLWAVPVQDGRAGAPQLLKPDFSGDPLGLTPAGTLYYGVVSGGPDIFVASFDHVTGRLTSEPARLLEPAAVPRQGGDWSPDGRYLAYFSFNGRASESKALWIRDTATGQARHVTYALPYVNAWFVKWTPDGKSIVTFGRDFKGRQGLFRIDVQTGETVSLALEASCNSRPPSDLGLTPDGVAAFCLDRERTAILRFDIASKTSKELLRGRDLEVFGASPDGRYLAYKDTTADGKSESLKILTLASGEVKDLVRVDAPQQHFRPAFAWTPDSRSIVFKKTGGTTNEMWFAPIDGRPAHRIEMPLAVTAGWHFNPKTNQVTFGVGAGIQFEVWKMENFLPASSSQQ